MNPVPRLDRPSGQSPERNPSRFARWGVSRSASFIIGLGLVGLAAWPVLSGGDDRETICQPSYSDTIRQPSEVTNLIKRQLCLQQLQRGSVGFGEASVSGCMQTNELDDRVPLCLGGPDGKGQTTDNLWLQPWPEAHEWDHIEAQVCRDYCDGKTELQPARQFFTTNKALGVLPPRQVP